VINLIAHRKDFLFASLAALMSMSKCDHFWFQFSVLRAGDNNHTPHFIVGVMCRNRELADTTNLGREYPRNKW